MFFDTTVLELMFEVNAISREHVRTFKMSSRAADLMRNQLQGLRVRVMFISLLSIIKFI
jgi:hypothetical protein